MPEITFRAYSALNLMTEELKEPVNAWERLLQALEEISPIVKIEIDVPARYYLKARDLCRTVTKEYGRSFTVSNFCEFLLREQTERYAIKPEPLTYYGRFKQMRQDIHIQHFYQTKKEPLHTIVASVNRKHVYDMEMILADIDEGGQYLLNDMDGENGKVVQKVEKEASRFFTVEEVLELRFTNYFNRIVTGINTNPVERIIKFLKNDEAREEDDE